ncbi:MAG: hypothetical protein ACOYJE_03645 [Bacteroidaceae bacterium]|jgi:F0F1-type ATP synthase membrane subunit a
MTENKLDERIIKKASRRIELCFYSLWGAVILLVALFELEWLPVGLWEHEDQLLYYMQVVGVLVALALIPFSLKFFHVQVGKLQRLAEHPETMLRRYVFFSYLRIGGLAFPILFNLILYYLSLNKAPGFMALITLLATIFCIPSEERLKYELNWDKKEVPQKQKDEE